MAGKIIKIRIKIMVPVYLKRRKTNVFMINWTYYTGPTGENLFWENKGFTRDKINLLQNVFRDLDVRSVANYWNRISGEPKLTAKSSGVRLQIN